MKFEKTKGKRMTFGWPSERLWLLGVIFLMGAATARLAGATCDSAPSGIVAWWPGDGTANDIVGTNNGALTGGATATVTGMVGTAFSFDGTNSYVQIPDAPALKPTNLTVEAWVKFNSLNSSVSGANAGEQYMVFKQNTRTGNFEGYYLGKTRISGADHFTFQVSSSGGTTVELDSVTTVTTNTWYHVTAVRGTNFAQLFVNGALEVQATVSFAQDYGTLPVYFGTSGQTYWDGKLSGVLDEVSLYSRALVTNEIAAIFAAGAAGKCKGAAIVTGPQSQTVNVGSNVLFSVSATGYGTLSYQWKFDGTNLASATNSSLTLSNVQTNNAGSYTVVVTNKLAAVTSSVATLTVLSPPGITTEPQGQVSECGSGASFSVAATGSAPLGYQWYFNGSAISGATSTGLSLSNVHSAQQGSYAVVVTNSAGAITSTPAAVLTAVDTTPPVVTMLGANPLTMECHGSLVDPGATANDVCAGVVAVVTNSTVNPNAVGTYAIKYVATDSSGNSATNVRTVIVTDTTPPTLTLNGPNPMTNECHAAFTDPGATANDLCAGALSVNAISTVNPNAVGVYSILYVATDPNGNSATNTRTVVVVDRTPPVITINGASPLTNECHAAFSDPGATANDVCAGALSVNAVSTVNPNAVGTYTIQYTATDPSGNTATNTRTVVVVDTTAPVMTMNGANPLTNECHAPFVDPGATANDSCAGAVAVTTNSTVNPNAAGSYTIKYIATDPSGNSVTNSRTVVVVDTTPPVITMNGASPLTNECHAVFVDPGATASDSCAGNVFVVTNNTVNPNAVGTYVITYVATDPSGNTATNTRTVVVVDTTPPVMTMNGANPMTNECHAPFVDPGATASDSCAGAVAVATNSTVNPNAVGTYTIRYTATDPSGNSVTNTRTVVVVDTTPPVMTMNGANPMTNECHAAFVDPGATASDSCAGSVFVVTNNTVNPNAVGTYTIRYTATDPSGNSVTNTRTVVVVDTTAPVMTMNGANPLTNECHAPFVDPGATANDSCAGSLPVGTNNTVNPNSTGIYTISYSATDPSGNFAIKTRTVYVVDTTKPTILSAVSNVTVTANANCQGVLPDLTSSTYILAADVCSSVIVTQFPPAGTIYSLGTTNLVALTAVDSSGNTTNRMVSVIVPGGPSIAMQPTNLTVVVSNSATFSVAACGTGQLRYQWQHANTNLPGATNLVLTLSSARTNDSGSYVVIVTNTAGAVTSQVAVLTVLPFGILSDPNLNAVVMALLGKTTCDISALDLAGLTNLYAANAGITNLAGLSAATNLTTLYVGGNAIADLTPLQGLANLTTLFVQNNLVTNLSPLAGLTNLTYLDVRWNPLTNYEATLGTMTELTELYLGGDVVTNASIVQNLGALRVLDLDHTTVADLSPLTTLANLVTLDAGYDALTNAPQIGGFTNLTGLYLSGNSLSNVTFVTNLSHLTSLVLCSNSLTSVAPLAGLSGLNSLHVGGNRTITNYSGLTSLVNVTNLWLSGNAISNASAVQSLAWLGYLNLDDNAIRDPSPVAGLTRLSSLSIERNLITNGATLGGLSNLSSVWFGGNLVSNVTFMASLSHLAVAEFDGDFVSSLSPLAGLTQLNYLSLKGNAVSDASALTGLTNLFDLRLGGEGTLSDLTFIAGLTQLTYLDLDGNQISNVGPLAALSALTFLDLNTNQVASISALGGMTNLASLSLQQNRLTDISMLPSLPMLSSVDVRFNLLNLSPGSSARTTIQTLTTRCPPVTVQPTQPDTAPSQRTAPTITVLTPLASLINGTWPLSTNVTSTLLFQVSDTGPASEKLSVGAHSSNDPLIPNASLNPTGSNQNWSLNVTPTAAQPNTAILTLAATNDVGLSTNVTISVTVVSPQSVVFPDPNLNTAVRAALGKKTGTLTTLDLMSLIDLSAGSLTITNLSGLENAGNLSTADLIQNSITDIHTLTNLPRLLYANLVWNLLNLDPSSAAVAALNTLSNRNVVVLYLPQRTAPTITASPSWSIGPNRPSTFYFTISDTVASSAQLKVGATSSNPALMANTNLVLARYIYDPYWTMTATPAIGLTGSTIVTLSATNDVGLYSSVPVTIYVVAPIPLTGAPLDNWTSMSWLTMASAPWFVQTNYEHDGLPAAQSGAIGDGEDTWLQTSVVGPGTLTFWHKVSSEAGFDFLEFFINDVLQTNLMISGEVDWTQRVINLPTGSQTLRWDYVKDNSGKAGMDAGWLAEVNFTQAGLRLQLPGPPLNGQMLLLLYGTVGDHYEIDASSNLTSWGAIVTFTNTATNSGGIYSYTDTPPTNVGLRYYRAKQLP